MWNKLLKVVLGKADIFQEDAACIKHLLSKLVKGML